jgi:hypothetical protein
MDLCRISTRRGARRRRRRRDPLPPPVIGEYAQRDVRRESSEAKDGEDLAHRQVRLLAHLRPSSRRRRIGLTSRRLRQPPSRPCSIIRYRLFEKIATPKPGAWSRTSVTGRTITAGGAVRRMLHVVDLDAKDFFC